jgi:hypothetical protein
MDEEREERRCRGRALAAQRASLAAVTPRIGPDDDANWARIADAKLRAGSTYASRILSLPT